MDCSLPSSSIHGIFQERVVERGAIAFSATHPNILAWKSPWTEEPGGLQSIELQRAGHDWMTNNSSLKLETSTPVFFAHLVP